jgi:hypothetical protein
MKKVIRVFLTMAGNLKLSFAAPLRLADGQHARFDHRF